MIQGFEMGRLSWIIKGSSNAAVGDVTTVAKGWRDAKMGPPAKECRWLQEAESSRKEILL